MSFAKIERRRLKGQLRGCVVPDSSGSGVDAQQQFQVYASIVDAPGHRPPACSRLATLLPESGAQVATVHERGSRPYRITVERPAALPGADSRTAPGSSADPVTGSSSIPTAGANDRETNCS
jgi:hypothetical protein